MTSSSRRNEVSAVAVLALGFGLVGIDRFLIATMFPVIARDLHLGYGDIGTITGVLAIAWGLAALLMGNLADRIGRRRVLVGALTLFSLLIGASGLATGLIGLVIVRIVMGVADGAYTPASISATIEASPVKRHGRNIGIQQMTLTLFGLGLAPLMVAQLLNVINWRWIFPLFAAPGLVLAWLTSRVLVPTAPARLNATEGSLKAWGTVLRYRNIWVLMGSMLCWLTCLVTTSAFMPSYMLDHLKLSFGQMGVEMSAIGFGAAAGTLLLPWLSDYVGRRTVMLTATACTATCLTGLESIGGRPLLLFVLLFSVHFFNNALITLTVGPVCSETVPPRLMATASGVVIAVGELIGGGLAPIAAGAVADRFGIAHLLWLPTGVMVVGFVLCLCLRDTRASTPVPTSSEEWIATL